MMAYCLDPTTAWPPLCPQRTPTNKSNPVFWQGLRMNSLPTRGSPAGRPRQRVRAVMSESVEWHGENQFVPSANSGRIYFFILKPAEKSPNMCQKKEAERRELNERVRSRVTGELSLALSDVTKGTNSSCRRCLDVASFTRGSNICLLNVPCAHIWNIAAQFADSERCRAALPHPEVTHKDLSVDLSVPKVKK